MESTGLRLEKITNSLGRFRYDNDAFAQLVPKSIKNMIRYSAFQ